MPLRSLCVPAELQAFGKPVDAAAWTEGGAWHGVAGIALAVAGLLLIIATHAGHFG